MKKKIIIIGAGPGGLTAGIPLRENVYDESNILDKMFALVRSKSKE